jgi:FHA domain
VSKTSGASRTPATSSSSSSTCSRCRARLSRSTGDRATVAITCPQCGAPQPDPSWTLPFAPSPSGISTLESSRGEGGGLAPGKKYALVVVQGQSPGRVIAIDKPRVILGRTHCDVVLEDPELSRQHALIAINGTSVRLEDLKSTNGTFVGGERVEQAELSDRSEFRIGGHELVFVMRDDDGEVA